MTEQLGYEQIQAPPQLSPLPRRRRGGWWPPSGWNLVAIIVLLLGIGVATTGLVVASSDEPATLRQDIRQGEQAVATARTDVQEARAQEASVRASAEEYLAALTPLTKAVSEGYDSGARINALREEQLAALQDFLANPTDAGANQVDGLSDDLNAEADRLHGILDEARGLWADVPVVGAG